VVSCLDGPNNGKKLLKDSTIHFDGSKSLATEKRTKLPVISAVLTIVSAAILVFVTIVSVLAALINGGQGFDFAGDTNIFFWIAVILQFTAFAFGLAGSVFQIKRKFFISSFSANIFLIVCAGLMVLESYIYLVGPSGRGYVYAFSALGLFAIPILIVSSIAIVLLLKSRREFAS